MARKFLFAAAALVLALSPATVRAQDDGTDMPGGGAPQTGLQTEDLTINSVDGAAHVFHIELALEPEQEEIGLMYRTSMAADAGMLFPFSDDRVRIFWMKNTLIPLDMVFIKRDGIVDSIHADAKPKDLSMIPSAGPVAAVLEINGGTAAKLGIKAGDRVEDARFFKAAGAAADAP